MVVSLALPPLTIRRWAKSITLPPSWKAKGATRIVVIGHSLGANAAIGYAARYPDLAGVVVLSPGHLPEQDNMRSFVSDVVARAKKRSRPQGNAAIIPDMAQDIPLTTTATPTVYLSMFDPRDLAVDLAQERGDHWRRTETGAAVWVVGKLDSIDRRGPEYAFNAAAKNPKSTYRGSRRPSDRR